MDKIASPQELAHELRRILAYTGSENPSRVKLAADLQRLARQMAVDEEAWVLADDASNALAALQGIQEGATDLAELYSDTPWKRRKLDLVKRETRDALRSVQDILEELKIIGGRN